MHTHFTSTNYFDKLLKGDTREKLTITLFILLLFGIIFIGILSMLILNFQITITEALSLIRYEGFWVLFFWTFLLSLPIVPIYTSFLDILFKQKTKYYDYLSLVIGAISLYVASLGISSLVLFLADWPPIFFYPILIGLGALEVKIADWVNKLERSRRVAQKMPTNLCLEHQGGIIPLAVYTVVGRGVFSGLPEEALARLEEQHAAVYYRDGEWWVEDLGSRYGTYLNGVKVKKERLKEGDVVSLGAVVDVVVKPCEKTPAQTAAPHTGERRRAVVKLEETEGKATGLHHGPEATRHTTLPGRDVPEGTPTNIRNVVKLEETESADRT